MSADAVATIWEDTGCQVLARITGSTGGAIGSTDITQYNRTVYDLDSTSSTAISGSTVASSTANVFSLKTGSRWTEDATGFNFADTVLPTTTVFARANRRYRVEYAFTPSSTADPPYKLVAEISTKSILGS